MNRQMLVFGLLLCTFVASVNHATAAGDLAEVIALPGSAKGGVIVYVGSGDADAMLRSRDAGRFLVQSVLFDSDAVNKARQALLEKKAYGPVAVIQSSATRLPYTDNFVNIVAIDNPAEFIKSGLPASEVARVVAPHGVVLVAGDDAVAKAIATACGVTEASKVGSWTKIVKPRPKEMDEWTQGGHDPEGSCVSNDTLIDYSGVVQWLQGPIWLWPGVTSRTADGKNYYDLKGELTCRDSFNGTILWRIPWQEQKSFTAFEKRVYGFMPGTDHLVALEGNTGKVVQHYKDIKGVTISALVHVGENMIFAADDGLGSVNSRTGKLNWMNTDFKGSSSRYTTPDNWTWKVGRWKGFWGGTRPEIRVSGNYVLYYLNKKLTCLNLADGKELWTQDYPDSTLYPAKYGIYVIKYATGTGKKPGGVVEGRSLKDGRTLWQYRFAAKTNFRLYASNGLIWDTRSTNGRDPLTGEVKKPLGVEIGLRCGMEGAATVNCFFRGRPFGVLSIETGKERTAEFMREGCGASPTLLLGNGMIYSYPKLCGCFSMLRGYTGFAPPKPLPPISDDQRLLKGPAYGTVSKENLTDEYATGWATYLGNEQRSGCTSETIPSSLKQSWKIKPEDQTFPKWTNREWKSSHRVSGTISAPTAYQGMVAVALPESHRIKVFEADTGKDLWSFVAESRVVLPPTFYGKMVFFGSEDGYVYCLRSKDGALIWRYQAAPAQRRVSVFSQIESHFPVTFGVLVKNGSVYFAAGRHADLNNGLTGYKLDAYTGQFGWKKMMESIVRKGISPIPDIPVYVNGDIRLAQCAQVFNEQGEPMLIPYEGKSGRRGETPPEKGVGKKSQSEVVMIGGGLNGVLDHTWSRSDRQGNNNIPSYSQSYGSVRGGQVVYNKTMAYALHGASVTAYDIKRAPIHIPHHTQIAKMPAEERALLDSKWDGSVGSSEARAMAVTNEIVAVAAKSGDIVVFDANSGKKLSEIKLNASPLRWGLAIAGGKIYLSTDEGYLLCFSGTNR